MANEFIIKNGFISKDNSIVEGGFTANTINVSGININGNLTVTGNTNLQSFTGTSGTINGNLTVTGNTSLQSISATTISASTISAPGSTTQVIYNNGGVLSADTGFVYSGGSIGIGTTTPYGKLSVEGDITFASNGSGSNYLFFKRDSVNTWTFGSSIDGVGVGDIFKIAGNNQDFFQVGSFKNGMNLTPGGNSTTYGLRIAQSPVWSSTTLANLLQVGTNDLFVSSGGTVGIGNITPSAKLHINNTTSGNTFLAEDDTNPDSTPFVIDASGNTGIGTLTPQAKLDVSGTTRITGSITSNTITEYFNDWRGTQNISSGFTPFSVTTHTLFAPTISSQATNARPYGLIIIPSFNGTIDSKHAVYISNTNTSPTSPGQSPGFNTSLVINSLGANELGQFIRVSGSSTIGSYIDQAQTGQLITRIPSGGTGLSINRTGGSEVAYTPINTFQQLSGTPSQSIFEYRNISSGNSTEINGLDLLNSSTAKFSSTLGNNAGINLRLGITNALGVSSRYAKIAAIAPNQSTLPDVIDLGLYVSDTGGTTTNAIYIKGSDQNVGIGITSPTAKLHINNTTSGNTFLAEDSTNPDSSPFIIDASGNTGIGTLTPTAKLQVSGDTKVSGSLTWGTGSVLGSAGQITCNSTITAGNFRLTIGGGLSDSANGSIYSFAGRNLELFTDATAGRGMVIFSGTGNVGIGTTTDSGNKLDVIGNTRVSGNTIITSGLSASTVTITTQPTSGYTSTQILMRNSTSGQVEITDSTSPSIYNYGMSYAMTTFNYLT